MSDTGSGPRTPTPASDTGQADTGHTDTGHTDTGHADAGQADAGHAPDAGSFVWGVSLRTQRRPSADSSTALPPLSRPRLICLLWRSAGATPHAAVGHERGEPWSRHRAGRSSSASSRPTASASSSEARGQANGATTSALILKIPHRPVASVQVGQRILQVRQRQLLDHALDQLGVADRGRSGQLAGRAWAAPPEHRTPGRLGHLQALERPSDGWADLAEPLGQGPVTGGQDVDDERAGLLRGLKERRGGVDQAEQACRFALGDQDRGHRQAGPARWAPGGPDGDRCHQPPAQPAGRVATLGWDGEGRLAPDADRFLSGGHASIVPALPREPTTHSVPTAYAVAVMGWNEAITATASTSMSRSSRTSRRTSTAVLAGGCWVLTYWSRTSRTMGSWVASTR